MQITPVQALKRFSTWRGHFWVLAAALLALLWMTGVHFRQHAVDYSTYYRAGKWILEGRVAEVYQPELQGMVASLGVDLSPMAATLPVALLLMTPFFIGPFLDPSRMTVQVRARLFAVALYWIPLINPASWFNMGLFYLPLAMLSLLEVNRRWFGLLGFFVFYTLTGRGLLGQEGYARVAAWNLPFFGVMLLLFSQMGSQVLGNPGSARRPGYQPRT
jgi:hypothetical protein